MRVTAASIACTAVSVVFGGVNAYANPVRFISLFAIGIIFGASRGKAAYDQVMENLTTDRDAQAARRYSVRELCGFLPGPVTAVSSLFGYVLRHLSKGSQLDYLTGFVSPFMLGRSVGVFIYFNKLGISDKPEVKRLTRMATL